MTLLAPLLLAASLSFHPDWPEFTPPPVPPVQFPPPPFIVSVYDENQVGKPIPLDGSPILLWGKSFVVTVSGIQIGDEVIAYLDNERAGSKKVDLPTLHFSLGIISKKLSPGCVTSLTVRVVRNELSSSQSLPVCVLRLCKDEKKEIECPEPKKDCFTAVPPESLQLLNLLSAIFHLINPSINDTPRLPPLVPYKDADTFATLPKIEPVPSADAQTTEQKQDLEGMKAGEKDQTKLFWVSNFPGPAHFPYPLFGPEGEKISAQGVLIYEGMQFKAEADGKFEVRFTAAAPAMPVTLRLQLLVTTSNHPPFTLTLPPFEFIPPDMGTTGYQGQYQLGNYLHRNYHVLHEGYSPLLAQYFSCLKGVHRQGTARFGSLPTSIR